MKFLFWERNGYALDNVNDARKFVWTRKSAVVPIWRQPEHFTEKIKIARETVSKRERFIPNVCKINPNNIYMIFEYRYSQQDKKQKSKLLVNSVE